MVVARHRPFVLIIRDGWGANPFPEWVRANAVELAQTPVNDKLMAEYPHTRIITHGSNVGLPEGVMGNSEVGHQNIGAGRVVDQELMLISRNIRSRQFFENAVMHGVFENARQNDASVHVMGLCSDAGVHSSLEHLYAILEFAKRANFDPKRVCLHMFSDGRDTGPFDGIKIIKQVEAKLAEIGVGRIASIIGRYYAMDRDNRWERVELAYRMLTEGKGIRVATPERAFQRYYNEPSDDSRKGDEFILPTVVIPEDACAPATIADGDSVVLFNFRGDRPRELVKAFRYVTFPYFEETDSPPGFVIRGFERPKRLDLYFATMSAYEKGLPVKVIIPKPPKMEQIFGQYISDLGLIQFRCAETEKYPHVTFFFNDYREEPFPGEERTLIPSPRDVATYDLKPEMSAHQVTDEVVSRIHSGRYDVVIVNFANGDMVGHTGVIEAAVKAVETVDFGVGRIVEAALAEGGAAIITADHGNCEQMIDPETGQPHTSHTTYDVDLIAVGDAFSGRSLREGGRLADICPTILEAMSLEKPAAMTGQSLLI